MHVARRLRGLALGVAVFHAVSVSSDVVIVARRGKNADPNAGVGVLRCWPPGTLATNSTVTVQTADGRILGHRVLWWRPGEPLDLRFDASAGVGEVSVRLRPLPAGQGGDSATAWTGPAGVVLETRRRVSDAVDSWEAVKAHWDAAGEPLGRSEVRQIFDGIHRHGPTMDFLSRYEGWFRVPTSGKYGFATISDDASFLLVNGKVVAEWPGWHGTDGGRHGQHNGWLQLNAGVHRIEYYNVQNDVGLQVAAWRKPGQEAFEVMPPEAFVATARFEEASVQGADALRTAAVFRWRTEQHVVSDAGPLVGVRFDAVGVEATPSVYRWRFSDGAVREGRSVAHVFCGASLAAVSLEVLRDGMRVGYLLQPVNVRPDWTQRAEFDEETYKRLLDGMPDAVFRALAPAALSAWVAWATQRDDRALLERLAAVCLARARTMDSGGADALFQLGLYYQHPSLRRYEDARTVWKALLALRDAPADTRGRTALHLGGMTLHCFGDARAAEVLFAEAKELLPEGDDRRLLDIYRGDLRVVQDRIEDARTCYLLAGTVVEPHDVHYEVRRIERLERARRFLAAGEHDAAEQVLREIEWERPMERMGLDTGLLLARVQRARGEREFAVNSVRRLRRVATGDPRHPELLWLAAQVLREADAGKEADAAVAELRKLFPYSEEAAVSAIGSP